MHDTRGVGILFLRIGLSVRCFRYGKATSATNFLNCVERLAPLLQEGHFSAQFVRKCIPLGALLDFLE